MRILGDDIAMSLDHARAHTSGPRLAHQALADRVAARIQSYFDTTPLCAKMSAAGFRRVDDIGPAEIATRFFPQDRTVGTGARRACHARLNDLRGDAARAQPKSSHAILSPLPNASASSR
jgi:hypothetical protein